MRDGHSAVDPRLIAWLVDQGGLPASDVAAALEQRSGLAGRTGTGDLRVVLERAAAGDHAAGVAVEVYVHRLAQEIAGTVASAQGVDALVFTGGVGEHATGIRKAAVSRLGFSGPVSTRPTTRPRRATPTSAPRVPRFGLP